MPDFTSRTDSRRQVIIAALLIAALWLATRRYLGVFNDSRLYTLQALDGVMPGRLSADLFLAFGSQDRFSVFSKIYGPFLQAFGITGGNIALLLICAALWFAGLAGLARGWLGDARLAVVGMAIVIVVPAGVFMKYGEGFLTPRLLAEALVLLAIGAMLRGRPLLALATLVAAAAVHPLTALPGLAVLFLHECRGRRWLWGLAIAGAGVVLALAFAGIEPFGRLLQRFDDQWFDIVRRRDDYCLVSQWTQSEWMDLGWIAATGVLGLLFGPAPLRRLLGVAMAVAAIGLGLALVGGDLLHNVLIVDIQPWRWWWLGGVIGNLALASLLLPGRGTAGRAPGLPTLAAAAGLLLMVVSRWWPVAGLFAPAVMLAGAVLALTVAHSAMADRTARSLGGGLLLIALMLAAAAASGPPGQPAGIAITPATALTSLAIVVAILIAIVVWASGQFRAVLPLVAILLVGVAAWRWDNRDPWRRFVDAGQAPADLVALLPEHGQTYWEGDMTPIWLMLKRPSYFSCEQGAGVLFNRATAIAWRQRADSFMSLRTLDFRRYAFCPLPPLSAPPPSRRRADLTQLCRREPGLSALVLAIPVIDAPSRTWRAPVAYRGSVIDAGKSGDFRTDRFYIYTCSDLR